MNEESNFYDLATRCIAHNEDTMLTIVQAEAILWAANKLQKTLSENKILNDGIDDIISGG